MSRSGAFSQQCLEEERRIFYVACSRAKDLLYVTWPGQEGDAGETSFESSVFQGALHELPGVEFLQQMAVSAPVERAGGAQRGGAASGGGGGGGGGGAAAGAAAAVAAAGIGARGGAAAQK